ncbi:glycosyltransferase [Pleomorphochaeta sp. DL1XJH-081]|uniref:glycosyltransferase n=1 Tax=Pleomorphochaeta sp. DL1XJH-081 TaxID=3409690 RepID=UPI003BB4FFAA
MDTSQSLHQKTRVLYIVESFSTGVYAIIRDIACNLDKEKFEVKILYSLRADSPKNYTADFAYSNISLQFIDMSSPSKFLSAITQMKREIVTFLPHTIHLHSSKAGVLGRLASRRYETNLLYSPHGFAFLKTDVRPLVRYTFLQIERIFDKLNPAKIITVSKGELEQSHKITNNSTLINNFVDVASIASIDAYDHQKFDISTTGRISAQKNPMLFNEIALRLPNLSFIWIGDGPLRNVLTAKNITVTGFVPRIQAIQRVKGSKIYLQTSLWEGMPVSLLEAMAAAKAIIATDIIGNRDLIEDGKTGYLCTPSDIEKILERITELINNTKLRNELEIGAFGYVEKHHNLDKAVRSYETIYANLSMGENK